MAPQPWAVAFCAVATGLCTWIQPIAGAFAATAIGALLASNAPMQSRVVAILLLAGPLVFRGDMQVPAYWLLVAEAVVVAAAPRSWGSAVLRAPRWCWIAAITLATIGLCGLMLGYGLAPTVLAMLSGTFLGASVARHLAMTDARLLAWGDESLTSVTRDLLLGRITKGMLHDLAQPLNVISMANGNMGYIVDHLTIGDDERRHLVDRIERIATHTQSAATILSLFRWFGHDGSDDPAALTVRSALGRAVAATRSNVRHHGVSVELHGNALDYLLPTRHGALEMIAVAALLCAFGSFIAPDGTNLRGKVLLHAALSPAHVVLSVRCIAMDGAYISGKAMDDATAWLVEQVAHDASGDFRAFFRNNRAERFVIRLGRDDN